MIAAGLELILGKQAPETLVDSMWALASPEVFTKLTRERGWHGGPTTSSWLIETASALIESAER